MNALLEGLARAAVWYHSETQRPAKPSTQCCDLIVDSAFGDFQSIPGSVKSLAHGFVLLVAFTAHRAKALLHRARQYQCMYGCPLFQKVL